MKKKMDYTAFYERIGQMNGWDFSSLKVTSEDIGWNFYEEVTRCTEPSDLMLDIGTGGGEAVLSIAHAALLLVGIDLSHGMIETAQRNLKASGSKSNVRLVHMNAEQLTFPDQFFNVVSSRHCDFCATEVYRALGDGGIFLTQQVSENDKCNISEAFGLGQSMGVQPGTLMERYKHELGEAGFQDIQVREYNATEYYTTPDDLLFLLTHAPIIPGFGEREFDFECFQQFVEQNRCDKGIRTNSARFMLTARK
ncbi:class I SAM-dependent methyltransferase [Paenibacillus sp. UMB7766-LJ446]|uniref:class I SAM-dependent methyltransferase n=1 Tax=Paenibacillus sp. UMB7766-LJ446 TaxID=3046313 RepID=UPI0025500525|nr:class I SAM-dependent methyltransferase [Paenibacillus sp. UMB7766-LJ446]MDK8193867.1 class I SAM-dependent methyltransferase [Paenibacillus sp. UMB7766-LJ446]